MSRVVGTETEYGIATPEPPEYSPIISSTHAVVAYAALHTGARSRWDFAEEHPLRVEFWQDGAYRLHDRFRFTRGNIDTAAWEIARLYP